MNMNIKAVFAKANDTQGKALFLVLGASNWQFLTITYMADKKQTKNTSCTKR